MAIRKKIERLDRTLEEAIIKQKEHAARIALLEKKKAAIERIITEEHKHEEHKHWP